MGELRSPIPQENPPLALPRAIAREGRPMQGEGSGEGV